MASNSGGPKRLQKYPVELRERAVRMVLEIRRETGKSHGVIARVARELGVGAQSLSGWVSRAEVDSGNRNFTATAPDQLWVSDFTYCSTWSGVVYVAFVVDVFSGASSAGRPPAPCTQHWSSTR